MSADYNYSDALVDTIGQIRAMKDRSDEYKTEFEAEGKLDEADKHLRVFCVLKELERLANSFRARAAKTEGKA